MMRILLIALLGFAAYKGYQHLQRPSVSVEPLLDRPYLVVYGRESCSVTRRTLRDLNDARVRYRFESVDDDAVADVLHERMRGMGLDTRRYYLPVVDLNNTITVRPENEQLIRNAKALSL